MKREFGDRNNKVWLIGDSNPKNFSEQLDYPLDSKHPVRHNIFTSIIDEIQERVFNEINNRVDEKKLYIRNAIENLEDWNNANVINKEISKLNEMFGEYKPIMVLTFGSRAFEFVRRAMNGQIKKRKFNWNTQELGSNFIKACENFNCGKINVLPLLHVSIARGSFLIAHKNFCNSIKNEIQSNYDNYFIATGDQIADILIRNKDKFDCWER